MSAEQKYIHGTDPAEQERLARLNRMTNEPFLEFLGLEGSETLLEVGSGLGLLVRAAAERLPKGLAVGVEASARQMSAAQAQRAPNLRFCQADGHALPFRGESFDRVYCRYVLEHLMRPEQALSEMHRVLKRGGRLHVQENNILVNDLDPDCPHFMRAWAALARLQARLGGDALIGKKLFGMLRRAGFETVELSIQPEVHASGTPGFRPWVENLIGNIEASRADLETHKFLDAFQVDLAVHELHEFLERDDATALFYWNRAQAVKP